MQNERMEHPKISVIVPVYNVEKYIQKCVESICRQEYQNLEIILVDDCSSDTSGEICEQYAQKDERVKVLHHYVNQGVSAARNTGIENATGQYYLFIDSDDWIDAHLCKNVVRALLDNLGNADTVHWGYECVDMEGNVINREESTLAPQKIILLPVIFDEFMNTLTVSMQDLYDWFSSGKSYYEVIHSKKQMGSVWRYLFSADTISKNGISFENGTKTGEDIVFLFSYLQVCKEIVNIKEIHSYYYLQRPNSLINQRLNVSYK